MNYQTICLRSFAKLNLGLHILGRREDGFHEIRTVFQTIWLHDRIKIARRESPGLSIECLDASLDDPDNLVRRAAQAFLEVLEEPAGVHIRLEKSIPIGAGLGGGSSNAATTLLGLEWLLGKKLGRDQLFEIGGWLGSDVPFFFVGGTALGLGRGSEVYPLEEMEENHILLVVPPFPVATPNAYARASLTLTRRLNASMIPVFCSGYQGSLNDGQLPENDFEKSVLKNRAELRELKEDLIRSGARCSGLTGSGAALFGFFDSRERLEKAEEFFSARKAQVIRTQSLSRIQYWQCLVESLQ